MFTQERSEHHMIKVLTMAGLQPHSQQPDRIKIRQMAGLLQAISNGNHHIVTFHETTQLSGN